MAPPYTQTALLPCVCSSYLTVFICLYAGLTIESTAGRRGPQVLTYSMIQFVWTPAKFFLYFTFMYETLLYFTYFGMASVRRTIPGRPALQPECVRSGSWWICSVPDPVQRQRKAPSARAFLRTQAHQAKSLSQPAGAAWADAQGLG